MGCVNVHGSLLPKYRGAAPVQWAVINGETETGITTMLMDEGMDTGPVIDRAELPGAQVRYRVGSADLRAVQQQTLATAAARSAPRCSHRKAG